MHVNVEERGPRVRERKKPDVDGLLLFVRTKFDIEIILYVERNLLVVVVLRSADVFFGLYSIFGHIVIKISFFHDIMFLKNY